MATSSYFGGHRRFQNKGNEDFYWNLIQKYRESWIIIRLDLVSLISPLPSCRFWSNLVPMESSFQGASNATGCERFGEELAKDIKYYQKLTWWSRSRILVPSILGTSALATHPSTLAALPQFQCISNGSWAFFEDVASGLYCVAAWACQVFSSNELSVVFTYVGMSCVKLDQPAEGLMV